MAIGDRYFHCLRRYGGALTRYVSRGQLQVDLPPEDQISVLFWAMPLAAKPLAVNAADTMATTRIARRGGQEAARSRSFPHCWQRATVLLLLVRARPAASQCTDSVDARFGCDCSSGSCDHVASVNTSAQLSTAVGDTSKTCIKLAAGVVFDAPSSSSTWLQINHKVALVAEAGNATLDGLGAQRLMRLASAAADVSLCNLVLTNGKSSVRAAPAQPPADVTRAD